MKNEVKVVIGGQYGDEGKGLMTDFYAHKNPEAVVIRYNGGSQAGHTVTLPNGTRHVFSHFGSGTLNGNVTYLSEFFVVNPMMFEKERNEFTQLGLEVMVVVHPDAVITTPFDILINQALEQQRGISNHGSVGVGFGETLQRGKTYKSLTVGQVSEWSKNQATFTKNIYSFMSGVWNDYVPTRIDVKNRVTPELLEILSADELIFEFTNQLSRLLNNVWVASYGILSQKDLIFEGAQGLLLDQDYGEFPHVTRSNTGMRNVSNILTQIPKTSHDITVNYVTRSYVTRHGAGRLDNEQPDLGYFFDVVDNTNIPNDWQGSLRFAPLNIGAFENITSKDFALYAPHGATKAYTMTCMDQYASRPVTWDHTYGKFDTTQFDYISYGPTRNDVTLQLR